MRTMRIKLYKFDELNIEAQEKVIKNEIQFYIDNCQDETCVFWEIVQEMEEMQTPWFIASEIYLREKSYIIDELRLHSYDYTIDGKIF